jgi:Predicted membrane protein (DUF2079)
VDQAVSKNGRLLIAGAFVVGVVARFLMSGFGYNADLISYGIVSDILAAGGNVYAETSRYNYGPAWFLTIDLVRILSDLTADPGHYFRIGIVLVLTLADLAIAAILNRRFGATAAVLFFLNPVSILITGYHNQFDNVAIAVGLAAVMLAERAGEEKNRRRFVASLCLLGLSLTVKHILFLLPLWLAFREKRWRDRALAAGLPVAIFAASFLPYAARGWRGIVDNVFLYRSFGNGPVTSLVEALGLPVPPVTLLIAGLALAGCLLRRRPLFEAVLVYLVLLVVLSPAMTNQYLAIPMAAIAVALNPFYALYALAGTAIILSNEDGLKLHFFTRMRIEWMDGRFAYGLPLALLAAGLIWRTARWRRTAPPAPSRPAGPPG